MANQKTDPIPQIELRPIDSLVPYAMNSRKHSDDQITQVIMPSLSEFGWTFPVLADAKGIVAGHGRVMAANRHYANGTTLKFPGGAEIPFGMVPVIDCSGWSDAQRRAYVIMDNRSAEKGTEWDLEMLKVETDALLEEGFDINLTGFNTTELAELFALEDIEVSDGNPDEVPEPLETPCSVLGDVWICGPHKIACGDSTDGGIWDKLMGSEKGDCVLTDPPFGVSYQAKGKKAIENDDLTGENLRKFLTDVNLNLFTRLKTGSSLYVFHADSEGLAFRQSLSDAGFKVSQVLTWVKDSLVLGRSRYQWRHEPCLLADKPGSNLRWFGGRKQTTVVEIGEMSPFQQQEDGRWVVAHGDDLLIIDGDAKVEFKPGTILRHAKPKKSEHHPTQKPVALLERLLKNSGRPNDLVLEPFSGSGSTMMAAERVKMCCRAVELDPAYVDVAVMRWQAFTGRRAVHAETGAEFPVAPDASFAF